jgi:hypothetical protein
LSKRVRELKLLDVCTIWPTGTTHFTPWLAKEENADRLGRAQLGEWTVCCDEIERYVDVDDSTRLVVRTLDDKPGPLA